MPSKKLNPFPELSLTWPLTKTEPVLLIVTEPVIARCSVASAE
ncbi:conserved hypothetical protein [delta proteobacterium NaphS2]|nr:conserved hypothetical protein [delta proteobacterium NaphS2]